MASSHKAKHVITNGKSCKEKDENKVHGMGLMCSLRKLTPPKKSVSRSSSGNSSRSHFSSDPTDVSLSPPAHDNDACSGLHHLPPWSANTAETNGGGSGHQFFCPALNCFQKLSPDDVIEHAQEEHSLVISDSPDSHSNSIEVSEGDMSSSEGSAAWAPTLLAAFGTKFFFETWRSANGKWFMWVYHLGTSDESKEFLADLEISYGAYKLAYSGPVYSLTVPHTKITNSGRCLSFADGLAQAMLQPLEDGSVFGICYNVQVRRRADDDDDKNGDITKF